VGWKTQLFQKADIHCHFIIRHLVHASDKQHIPMTGALDVCIQELKRSSIFCLGPQISIRQVIETSIERKALSTSGGQLKHSKCLSTLVINSGDNAYLLLVNELCETFHKRNKTVSLFTGC
jgi:hypothetical protein